MELNKAFGSAFVFSDSLKLGAAVAPEVTPAVTPVVTPVVTHEVTHEVKPKRKSKSPEVYVLRVHICRDDCHFLCMFLFIFAVSFILSR